MQSEDRQARTDVLIDLKNIYKEYHSETQMFNALKNISLSLYRGECVACTGPSGSGKSTLLQIIGLLDRPTRGQYILEGQSTINMNMDALAYARNRFLGFIFQSFYLLPRLDAVTNVMLPLFYRGVERNEARQRAMTMLEQMDMHSFATRLPNQLSGGQQQRVAIARALVGNPELILADEPTGALDSTNANRVMDILIDINKTSHKTLLIMTHDPMVQSKCHRVIRLLDGELDPSSVV